MNKKQMQALREIGGDELLQMILRIGEKRTAELEALGIEFKAALEGPRGDLDFATLIAALRVLARGFGGSVGAFLDSYADSLQESMSSASYKSNDVTTAKSNEMFESVMRVQALVGGQKAVSSLSKSLFRTGRPGAFAGPAPAGVRALAYKMRDRPAEGDDAPTRFNPIPGAVKLIQARAARRRG